MAGTKYNIEEVNLKIEGDRKYIEIKGWGFANNKQYDYLYVSKNGNVLKLEKEKYYFRDDVHAVYPSLSHDSRPGFKLLVELYPLRPNDCFQLVGVQNSTKQILWEITGRKLKKQFADQDIYFNIDSYHLKNDEVTLRGWTFSKRSKKVDIHIKDNKGKQIEYSREIMLRPDVSKLFLGDDELKECGFKLSFPYEKNKKYYIHLTSQHGDKQVVIDARFLKALSADNTKKYKSIGTILRETSKKSVLEDVHAFVSGGKEELIHNWKVRYATDAAFYDVWYERNKPTREELEKQSKITFKYSPRISIIVPAYETPKKFLIQMIQSVQRQTYANWELCIADGGVNDQVVKNTIEKIQKKESRIKYKKLDKNLGISGNTNAALSLATGEIIALLDHDDILAPNALFEVVKAYNENSHIDVVYSDEDKISMDLKTHFEPHFKPDFSVDLLQSNNYICHLFTVKKHIIDLVGNFDDRFDGSQDHDFIFRCTEKARKIKHIPMVLYHWRMHQNSTAANPESKMYCFDAGKRAVEAHLKRVGEIAEVEKTEFFGYYRTRYQVTGQPLVSIVIPNKDHVETLKVCIDSIKEKTTYTNYEVIVVENNSTDKNTFSYYDEIQKDERIHVIQWKGIGFNYSAINNLGVKESKGEYIVLLNNDIEVITPDWIEQMLGECQRKDVGIVGVKLFYPDDTIQHCGVIVGLGGIAGHIFVGQPRNYVGYFARARLQQNLSAVTAACLMTKRTVYEEVGGLEEKLEVAFNDIDFCLKVREKGYLIVLNPNVEHYHYESKSRGNEDTLEKMERFEKEVNYMQKRWRNILKNGDPYYNINLSLDSSDFSLKMERESNE